uniref:WAC domain-containing protein n=1 Tax=Globodera rostochiensis TaxID=31243 RepID=A0A914HKS5_GLORO
MPTTQNKEFQRIRPIPDGLLPNTEIFYLPSTNEVFLEYDDYFERMIQLNSSCWNCTITGRASLTYDEALKSEQDAIEQINTFPAYLEVPILFLVHRFTGRARLDELVSDVTTFMRDRYFMDEKVTYRQGLSSHDRRCAAGGGGHLRKASSSMGASAKSPSKKSPTNKEDGLELCPPECIAYTLKILNTGGEKNDEPSSSTASSSTSSSEEEEEENVGKKGSAMPSQVSNVPHAQIGRGKLTNITRAKIKLFIRYYTELSADGCIVVKPSALADFRLDRSRWQHIFAGPEPKFPHTKRKKTSTTKAGEQHTPTRASALSAMSLFDDSSAQASSSSSFWGASPVLQRHQNNRSGNQQDDEATAGPSSSTTGHHHHHNSRDDEHQRKKKKEETLKNKTATSKADDLRKKRKINDQQLQLEPLFRQAEKAGVLQLDRWCQSRRLLTDAHIAALREAIHEAKEAERKRQVERRRRERESLAEWRKPRDDLLCEDLKPFPEFKALRWPDWVPREHYWDILTISSFFHTFAELLHTDANDQQSPCMFNIPQIATALVTRQIKELSCFYRLLDTLLEVLRNCINQDDGNAADLSNPDHIGNEVVKDFDHPVHGKRIRRINRECSNQLKIHGAKVWELSRDFLDLSEVIRLLLITSGFYTKWRRQLRGLMHCYEDDGFLFVEQHPDIIELLEKTSVYALNPSQRVRLINTFMDQLLRHSRFRKLIDDRIDELWELRRRLKQLKAVDQQHEKEARDALQHIQQHGDRQQQQAEDELLDKDEQKARAAAQRELTSLRRALVQLNEGRRVKDISDLRERVVDAQRPLPWRAMADVREVHEFRAVQRNFHADKQHALLHEIFQLQGKMCMFLLGRDRAFRSYYYMNSAIIIFCPRPGELGHCWGERTPMVAGDGPVPEEGEEELDDDDDAENDGDGRTGVEGGRDHQRQEEVPPTKKQQATREGARSVDSDGSREEEAADTPPTPKQNSRIDDVRDAQQEARKCAETAGDDETKEEMEEKKREEAEVEDSVPSLDAMMACTGGSGVGMEQCPVHNPPSEWPQLLFFVERDGVHKLLEALNPRGFREMELADNISLFRDIYNQEMLSLLDSSAVASRAANLGAHLFGFSRGMPKELKESAPLNLDLFDEVRSRLLELEELLHQRDIGSPCCSTNRQEWRVALETYGDTSMLCQGNCVPLIRPSSPTLAVPSTSSANGYHNNNEQNSHTHDHQSQQQQQNGVETTGDKLNFLYTREELSNTTAVPLSRVQKLGIALMQLVHGIRRDCFLGNFMNSVKRNGIVKILPTPSFVEWQRALKGCQSPSAIALFETTLEFSVNWEFKGPETVATVEQQKSKNAAKVRRKRMPRAGANAEEEEQDDAAADGPSTSTHLQHTRQRREVDNLLVEAGYMGGMAIGARKRKPVTKYGDVEMDVDKLDFDEEDEEEEEGEDGEMDAEEKEENELDELKDDDEEEDDNDDDDEEMLMDMGGRAVSTRQRKPVTKYGAVEMDVDNLNLDEEEEEEKEDGEEVDEEEKESSLDDI